MIAEVITIIDKIEFKKRGIIGKLGHLSWLNLVTSSQ